MSSSTSSSRKVYFKILLAVVFGMATSMAILRVIAHLDDVSGNTILSRVQEARGALPQILAEDADLVMAYGSSMTRAGFSARLFDRDLAARGVEVKSFNFGFGGLNPLFQDYLSRRIRDAFEAEDRKLELALIEFVPFQTTKARYDGALPVIDSFVTILASPQEIWEIAKQDPERGALMANIKYVRDQVSAEMITSEFSRAFRPPRPRSELPEDEEISKRRDELGEEMGKRFEEEYPDFEGEDWKYSWQGAGTIPDERSQLTLDLFVEFYETGRTPRELENDRLQRIQCCDIEELEFEEELVQAFIRTVQNFQDFSNHVEVVLYPRNQEWIRYSAESRQRLQEVLDRIEAATGVTIRNDQEIDGYPAEMFSDTTHLSRYAGDVKYTAQLAREYAPLLAASLGQELQPTAEAEPAYSP